MAKKFLSDIHFLQYYVKYIDKINLTYALIIIIPFFMILLLSRSQYLIYHAQLNNSEKNSVTEESASLPSNLFRSIDSYVEKDVETNRCLIVTGKWGQGKSFLLNKYFKEHKKYKYVYKVSCFGIKTREQLVNLVNEEIKRKNQLYQNCIDLVIRAIPVVGVLYDDIMDRQYCVGKTKESAIFILEDVERCSIDGKDIDAYNVVAGYVNELLEVYHKKVILVCDSSAIDFDIFNNLFYKKLSSNLVDVDSGNISSYYIRRLTNKIEELENIDINLNETLNSLCGILIRSSVNSKRAQERMYSNISYFLEFTWTKLIDIYKNEPKKCEAIVYDYMYSICFYEVVKEKNCSYIIDRLHNEDTISFLNVYSYFDEYEIQNNEWINELLKYPITSYFVGFNELKCLLEYGIYNKEGYLFSLSIIDRKNTNLLNDLIYSRNINLKKYSLNLFIVLSVVFDSIIFYLRSVDELIIYINEIIPLIRTISNEINLQQIHNIWMMDAIKKFMRLENIFRKLGYFHLGDVCDFVESIHSIFNKAIIEVEKLRWDAFQDNIDVLTDFRNKSYKAYDMD